jgi:putative ABC transport system permease protein
MSSSRSTRRADHTSGDGGVPARRAVVRWAWRLFRREWRQQVLVLALLTVAVASAIGAASAAYNLAPVPANSEFGSASHYFTFEDLDPATVPTKLAAAESWFGVIDVVSHRAAPIPGSVDTVDYRGQNPDGPYGQPMLRLDDGRYPTGQDEVALTDTIAQAFGVTIGDSFAADGVERTVVGLVENPSDLGDEFALVAPDLTYQVDSLTMLVDASEKKVEGFRPPGDNTRMIAARGQLPENVVAAIGVFVVAAIALFLVALVAAASFIVIAQRRQRQLGMLSALGATEKHLRLVMLWSGAVVGAVAALSGAAIGVVGWMVLAPHLEHAVGFRIDALQVPWWLVVVGMLLAVATAIGASWWPARSAARLPTVVALSGRPPRPPAFHRSAAVAALFLVGGIGCLVIAGDVNGGSSVRWTNLGLIAVGTLGTIVGVLLVSPLAIRALARCASRMPIAIRLPLRDLGRYQARSGAALAAISLALGVPVAVIATASAAESSAGAGNLSSGQLMLHTADIDGPFVPEAADVDTLQQGVDALTAFLDGATITPIDVALDPQAEAATGANGRVSVELGRKVDQGWTFVSKLYVATPALLDHYGISGDAANPDSGFLSTQPDDLNLTGPPVRQTDGPRTAGREGPEFQPLTDVIPLTGTYSSLPGTFITTDELTRRGWQAVPSGEWLIETGAPLTADQLSSARGLAAAAGLTIETRDDQAGLGKLRTGATAVGMALALGILAMTVGLIRAEATGDVRTLTATGASSGTRRTLTAATAGGMGLLGALLGIAGAYVALAAGPFGDLSRLRQVPVAQLVLIVAGTPLIAAATGWLLAGREPASLSRQPIA